MSVLISIILMEPEVGKVVSRPGNIVRDELDIHPSSQFVYDDNIHGEELKCCLTLDPAMKPQLRKQLLMILKKYFCVFIKKNVPISIADYEYRIDASDTIPKVAKNIRFGIHDMTSIQAVFDGLLQKNHLIPNEPAGWLAKLIGPKASSRGNK